MLPDPSLATDLDDARLDRALGDYFDRLAGGEAIDRAAWIEDQPVLADALRAFFEGEDRLSRLTVPLRHRDDSVPDEDRAVAGYDLLRVIGRGGMGIVYEARHRSLNRSVALKMIQPAALATPDDLRRFRDEAESVALLDHPNIVTIHEVGEHRGRPFYSMKKLDGGSLADRVLGPSADTRTSAKLAAEVARAVHHAHQRGILHRDLKPANILLDPEGRPYVADFGLAKRLDRDSGSTHSGALLGSPSYMAPEQSKGVRSITTATDVYGLGAILYWMLAGQPPFRADTVAETLAKLATQEPSAPRKLNPKVDRDLESICLKALEKEPARRYATAEALADDLERWLRHEPILARRIGRAERLVRWSRRNPVVASLAITIGAMAFAILTGLAIGLTVIARERVATKDAQTEARQKQELARDRALSVERATSAMDRVVQRIHAIGPSGVPRSSDVRRALTDQALQYYEGLLGPLPVGALDPIQTIPVLIYMANLHIVSGDLPRATSAFARAIAIIESEPSDFFHGDHERIRSIGECHKQLGFAYFAAHRHREAADEFRLTLDFFRGAVAEEPTDTHNLIYLARFQAICPDPQFRDPASAIALTRRAIALAGLGGKPGTYPGNTLGIAYYRAGDWDASIAALQRAMPARNGGYSIDWFYLAMAHHRRHDHREARWWYDRAERWMAENMPRDTELIALHEEANTLLGAAGTMRDGLDAFARQAARVRDVAPRAQPATARPIRREDAIEGEQPGPPTVGRKIFE